MPTVATTLGSLAYDELGAGPPLVLLAAGGHPRRDFDVIRPALAAHFRTIAVDWPGHGDSPAPADMATVSAPAFADVLEEVIDALDLGPAAFIGNSVGGFAAARFAIRRPQDVTALVLVDCGGFNPSNPAVSSFCWLMGHPGFLRRIYPAFATRYMRARTDADRRILADAKRVGRDRDLARVVAAVWASFSTPGHDLRGDATRITAPTLVTWGRKDPVIPRRVGRKVAATIPGARLVELDSGHVPFSSQTDQWLHEVLPFLAEAHHLSTPVA